MKARVFFDVEAKRYGVSHGWDNNLKHRLTVLSYRFTLPPYPQHAKSWKRHFHEQTTIEVDVDEFGNLPAIFKAETALLT